MKYLPLLIGLTGLSALTACGDGTAFQDDEEVPVGTVTELDGTYTITQGDREITLLADDTVTLNGQRAWLGDDERAQAFESDNVIAIGGVDADRTPFAAISGSVGEAPTGDATFTGRYAVLQGEDYESAALTLNYELDTGAITNDGGDLTVDATATEVNITGTVEYAGETGNLEGNFFGDDEIAGAFTGETMGGIIYGTQDE